MLRVLILSLLMIAINIKADTFIGQWYLTEKKAMNVAETRDGDSQLRIEVSQGRVTTVRLALSNFSSFGEEKSVLEYSSPVYGLVRTTNFSVENGEVLLTDPFEIHSFIENLKNIATQFMFSEDNLGNSFKDRKLTISYLERGKLQTWSRSSFSTIEIDEVLEQLGVDT